MERFEKMLAVLRLTRHLPHVDAGMFSQACVAAGLNNGETVRRWSAFSKDPLMWMLNNAENEEEIVAAITDMVAIVEIHCE